MISGLRGEESSLPGRHIDAACVNKGVLTLAWRKNEAEARKVDGSDRPVFPSQIRLRKVQ